MKTFRVAALALALAGTANAGPFVINTTQDFSGNWSASTSGVNAFGYSGTRATSFYSWAGASGSPLTGGSATGLVVDTNKTSLMNSLGFATLTAGPLTAVDGSAFNLPTQAVPPLNPSTQMYYPNAISSGEKNIDTLNPWASGGFGDPQQTNNYASNWQLTYEYVLNGAIGAGCSNGDPICFNSGFFEVFYSDSTGVSNKKVLQVNVTGSDVQPTNLYVLGEVDYSWLVGADTFVENFLVDVDSGDSFFDIWTNGGTGAIDFVLDSNVNPPVPTFTDDVVATNDVGGLYSIPDGMGGSTTVGQWAVRQTTLDGSAEFITVPEPNIVMLLGSGLIGVGFATRKRKLASAA